jgi:transcriptional regulator with XRE-family HTH domain
MKPGKRIRELRKEKGFTQGEFGDSLGYSDGFISQIEAGLREPSRKFLKKLKEVYGVSSDYILYSGGGADWEKLQSDLQSHGLDHDVIEKIHVHYITGVFRGDQEEYHRGFEHGQKVCEPPPEYTAFPDTKKLLDNVKEILESENKDIVNALTSNIKAFMGAVRAAKEKRRYHRFLLNIPVDVKILENQEARLGIQPGIVLNASQMGLLIQSTHDMPIGKRINLEVLIAKNTDAESFRTTAEIMWKDKRSLNGTDAWHYGVKLIEVLNEGHAKLESLLHK